MLRYFAAILAECHRCRGGRSAPSGTYTVSETSVLKYLGKQYYKFAGRAICSEQDLCEAEL